MLAIWQWLEREGANADLVEWSRPYGAELDRLWSACPRGDWLLALAVRLGAERKLLVGAACGCARLALAYLPEDEPRLHAALRAAEAFGAGQLAAEACTDERRHAAEALDAAA